MTALLATATAAASGATVAALVNGTPTVVQVARDLTVAAGDVIIVQRVGGLWFAIGRAWTAAPADAAPTPPPDPKPSITTGRLVVSPVETRSYRSSHGWRTDNTDVYQGQYGGWGNHTGCAFYGSKLRSLAGTVVTDARVQVRRLTAGTYAAQSTTLRLMTEATRPSGAPTLTSSTTGPNLAVGATGTAVIPDSWAQAIVNGTAGGIALHDGDGSPYVRYAGRGSWSPAWTMTVTWQRS